MFLLLYLLFIMVMHSPAQSLFNWPESIAFDYNSNTYYISNWGNGNIIAIDSLSNQSIFNSDMVAPAGIRIIGGQLFCLDRQFLTIINLENGEITQTIHISGSGLLNDLDYDNEGYLYISDCVNPAIIKMSLDDYGYSILTEFQEGAPNGVLMNNSTEILMTVLNISDTQSLIVGIDTDTGEITTLADPECYGFDGIAVDNEGRIYVSEWPDGSIYRFPSDFSELGEQIITGLNSPADIFINNEDNIIAIPCVYVNEVLFEQLDIEDIDQRAFVAKQSGRMPVNYPNPFNPTTTITFFIDKDLYTLIDIFNSRGRFIRRIDCGLIHKGENSVNWDGTSDNGNQAASGIYYYVIKCDSVFYSGRMLLVK